MAAKKKDHDPIKVTAKNVSTLPEGTYNIEQFLYLRVRGKYRFFFIRMPVDGKRKEAGIGSVNELSLPAAKLKVAQYKADVAAGKNPFEKTNTVNSQPDVLTFASVAEEAIEITAETRRWKNPKSRHQWEHTVRAYAIPVIGNKAISECDRDDMMKILQPMWETKTDTASKLRGRLERIFDYAIYRGWYEKANPARWRGNLDMLLPSPGRIIEGRHFEAPTVDEIKQFAGMVFLNEYVSHQAVIFGVLTATRANEFCRAQWAHIDMDARVWSIPTEMQKVERPYPHRVPLSDQAMAILKWSKEKYPDSEWIFPAAVQSKSPHISLQTPRAILIDGLKRPVTMHGCRSTFRDWAAENLIEETLAEKSLMHQTGSKVVKAYQRSDLLEQRRVVMQRWADEILPMDTLKNYL